MNEQQEVSVLKTEVSKLENQANQLTITTPEENAFATELKAKLKETGKLIKERKEAITKPLNAALKSARELFAPLEQQFDSAETIVGRKLLTYKQKLDADAALQEQRIGARVEKGTMRIETAERKLDEVQRVDKTTNTAHGQVQFRKIKKARFANTAVLSAEQIVSLARSGYFVWDQVKARRDALAGIQIPGVEIYEEEIV